MIDSVSVSSWGLPVTIAQYPTNIVIFIGIKLVSHDGPTESMVFLMRID